MAMSKGDKLIERYGRGTDTAEMRHEIVLKLASNYQPDSVLDVGCGDGVFTKAIASAASATEVQGIEIAETSVKAARDGGLDAYQCDIDSEDFPFDDGNFEAVTALEVFEHLFNPDNFLQETRRVLKPGGKLILSTPNLAALHNRVALLLGYQPLPTMDVSHEYRVYGGSDQKPEAADHIRVVTLDALVRLLRVYDFTIEEARGCTFSVFDRNQAEKLPSGRRFVFPILKRLDRELTRFPSLAYRVVLVAER